MGNTSAAVPITYRISRGRAESVPFHAGLWNEEPVFCFLSGLPQCSQNPLRPSDGSSPQRYSIPRAMSLAICIPY